MAHWRPTLALILAAALGGGRLHAEPDPEVAHATPTAADQQARLSEFNSLIGKWRGAGQPRRGSNQGAWQEETRWVWDFEDGGVAIVSEVSDGQLMKSARLTCVDAEEGTLRLELTTPAEESRTYTGRPDGDRLVLTTDERPGEDVHRITLTRLNEKRTLLLFERRGPNQSQFSRVAEVGYTRDGTRLAGPAANERECIVTGGTGDIAVMHKGQTYYVCCTGCLQAFEDDPDRIIAEAAERRAREQAGAR
ncbi:MAG: hypothetical protein KF774_22030 [Planctomyces sp.]|nr:hypothetical protein [Planctomyces sp.]